MAETGYKLPRPFAQTLHSILPNEVIYFDYLYMRPSSSGVKYILVLKYDLSRKIFMLRELASTAQVKKEI